MFGPFRFTNPLRSGLLWKTPWRLSKFQKRRQRHRLRAVDSVVETLETALAKKGETVKALERWRAEMPTEDEMLAKDKYTIFDRKEKRYRKGIHSMLRAPGVGLTRFGLADVGFSCRVAKVDACFSTPEPSWILDDESGTRWTTRSGGSDGFWALIHYPIEHGGLILHILEEEEEQRCETDREQVYLNTRKKVPPTCRSGPRRGFSGELDEDASGPDEGSILVRLTPDECIMDEDGRTTVLLPNDPIEINAKQLKQSMSDYCDQNCAFPLLYPLPEALGVFLRMLL